MRELRNSFPSSSAAFQYVLRNIFIEARFELAIRFLGESEYFYWKLHFSKHLKEAFDMFLYNELKMVLID